jgi:exonuclease SbcC
VDAAQKIEVDAERLGGDLRHLYKEYFMEDSKFFAQGVSNIAAKLRYIDYEYRSNKRKTVQILQARRQKMAKILKRVGEARSIYQKSLTDYKTEMIDKIRIPFYIYSAKILQNYQQGMGVFISSSGTRSGAIRFLTESGSDHDIVHHLSSGQLAVVSIAFSLAINKVYRDTSLDLICIDDPVYELDSLNIHSFVELLRRSFIGPFQVVLSTHDEASASYMKYRFEKIHKDSVSTIDVQNVFFGSKAE